MFVFNTATSYLKRISNNIDYELSANKIRGLKEIHQGQRCFIIGAGPSLNKTNFNFLKDEILFGVNNLYTGFKKFGISCQYYASTDPKVWENRDKDMLKIDTTLFLSGRAAEMYLANKNYYKTIQKHDPLLVRMLGFMWKGNNFSHDLAKGAYNGDTVILDVCLQAAYYLGFKKVYLLGCDCDYSGLHRFDGSLSDNMQGSGAINVWDYIFASYRIAKKAYEDDGREIINATVGGKLEIFRRQSLKEIITKGAKNHH